MATTAEHQQRRNTGWIWMLLAYLTAGAAAWGALGLVPDQPLFLQILVADVMATVVIFGFSVAFNNSSFYDPYWSVAPIFIAIFLLLEASNSPVANPRGMWVFSLILLWGARLTFNFMRGWHGLRHEDWRYRNLREQHGKWYWLVSFFGIHLFPTVLVYLGCLSLIPILEAPSPQDNHLIWLDILALVVTFGSIVLETVADEQMRMFRRSDPPVGRVMDKGVWAWSRHPNYFGETGFWFGLSLFAVAADSTAWDYYSWGPIVMFGLFQFISIPMMEKRQLKKRKAYQEYKDRVSRFIPWFPKKK